MTQLRLIVRTADQTRKATIEVDPDRAADEVLQTAASNWSLPADTDYTLVNTSTGIAIAPGVSLGAAARDGDVIEIQPVLVAGSRAAHRR